MSFRANTHEDVITMLYAAERHTGTFGGDDLVTAAETAMRLALDNDWHLLAADSSGERIVGTATTLDDCPLVDTSRRQDGLDVLVVAGMLAGPYGVAQAAARARSMGAKRVHCFYVGGWSGVIPGCDTVHRLVEASQWDQGAQLHAEESAQAVH